MKIRCYDENHKSYMDYGGRGILICKEWRKDFLRFYNDMNEEWFEGLVVDRIDNNKGYSRDNCRWVTQKENSRNRRRNVKVCIDGVSKCLVEWCEEKDIKYNTVLARMGRGWKEEDLFNEPKKIPWLWN